MFLRDAAASLRDLALRAPDIANELRRFADDLDEEAERGNRPRKDDAANWPPKRLNWGPVCS
jgi:hypothetical protein